MTGISPTQDALVAMLEGALRAEVGVRTQQEMNKPTGYYAGRRSGFVCSAAALCEHVYGVDYEAAKAAIGKAIEQTKEASVVEVRSLTGSIAKQVAELALLAH